MRALLVLLLSAAAAGERAPDTPFGLGVHFYVINKDNKAFDLTVLSDAGAQPPRRAGFAAYLMTRVYGPNDELLLAQETQLPDDDQYASIDLKVPAAGEGVYTIMLTGGGRDWVGVKLNPSLPYGVMGRRALRIRAGALGKSYLYAPKNCAAAWFAIRQRPARGRRTLLVFNSKNQRLASARSAPGCNEAVVTPKTGDEVWRVEFHGRDAFEFACRGLPGILCPNADAAKTIRGSLVEEDGAVFAFHWQLEMWKWLRSQDPGAFKLDSMPLDANALRGEGRRAAFAGGPYGPLSYLPALLSGQNLDPKSDDFGTAPAPAAGSESAGDDETAPRRALPTGAAAVFAWAYARRWSGNPYHARPALLYRAAAAAFAQYLRMNEAEDFDPPRAALDADAPWRRWPGGYACDRAAAFAALKDDLPAETAALWREALRRETERLAYYRPASTGAWALAALGHYLAASAGDADRAAVLWRRHVEALASAGASDIAGQAPAGDYRENGGVDGGYDSMAAFYLGCLWRLTRDETVEKSLQRDAALRAHLLLPEPDGRVVSPTNFNTRSARGFSDPVYPDAALLAGAQPWAAGELARLARRGAEWPWRAAAPAFFDRYLAQWAPAALEPTSADLETAAAVGAFLAHLADALVGASPRPLPMETDSAFTRRFGGEFLCVRRPAYYAVIYTARRRAALRASRVMQGGGLSAFWTPGLGASLFSVNDGPWFNHAVTGADAKGRVVSSSYAGADAELSDDAQTLRVKSRIPRTPLTCRREYRFDDDGLVMRLSIASDADWRATELFEVLPYLAEGGKRAVGLTENGDEFELNPGAERAGVGLSIVAPGGRVEVRYSAPVRLSGSAGAGRCSDGRVKSVRVALPARWRRGQTCALECRVAPAPLQ